MNKELTVLEDVLYNQVTEIGNYLVSNVGIGRKEKIDSSFVTCVHVVLKGKEEEIVISIEEEVEEGISKGTYMIEYESNNLKVRTKIKHLDILDIIPTLYMIPDLLEDFSNDKKEKEEGERLNKLEKELCNQVKGIKD